MSNPFSAVGNNIAITVTTTSAPNIFPALAAGVAAPDCMIANVGTNPAFIFFSDTTPVAVAPTPSVPANGICIPPGVVMVLSKKNANAIAAITLSGTTTLYISQGTGN